MVDGVFQTSYEEYYKDELDEDDPNKNHISLRNFIQPITPTGVSGVYRLSEGDYDTKNQIWIVWWGVKRIVFPVCPGKYTNICFDIADMTNHMVRGWYREHWQRVKLNISAYTKNTPPRAGNNTPGHLTEWVSLYPDAIAKWAMTDYGVNPFAGAFSWSHSWKDYCLTPEDSTDDNGPARYHDHDYCTHHYTGTERVGWMSLEPIIVNENDNGDNIYGWGNVYCTVSIKNIWAEYSSS